MENNPTPPATRTYCVWADQIRRVYQEVEADSPQRAHEIAPGQPECWQDCSEFQDRDEFRLSDEVQDVETGQYHRVQGATHCKTYGSEIVDDINDSNFREGECGPCEYRRYRSQPALLAACRGITGLIYHDKRDVEQIDFDQYEKAERACEEAITSAEHEHTA